MKQKLFFLLIIILVLCISVTAQSYDLRYQNCSESLSKLTKVDSSYSALAAMARARDSCLLGAPAPNFQAVTLDRKKIELSKLKGQVVVLNFWFTHCQPCIEEMPEFNKLVNFYVGKKVKFISFTYNDSAEVLKFLNHHPFKFEIVANNDQVRRDDFKLFSAWPYTIIINKEGKIMFMQFGSKSSNTFAYFKKQINNLL